MQAQSLLPAFILCCSPSCPPPSPLSAFFTSEIMITGYVIIFLTLVISVTAYCRQRMAYEVFYGLHHVFVVLYALTIAHTLDPRGRADFYSRMQCVLWCAAPIVLYTIDRVARNTTIQAMPITGIKLITSPPSLVITLRRRASWTFVVGQCACACDACAAAPPRGHPRHLAAAAAAAATLAAILAPSPPAALQTSSCACPPSPATSTTPTPSPARRRRAR